MTDPAVDMASPEILELGQQSFDTIPLHRFLGLRLVQMQPEVVIEMPISENVARWDGGLHGGATGVLIDVASGCAVAVGPHFDMSRHDIVTVDVMIRYGRKAKSGPVRATAVRVKDGPRNVEVDTNIEDADGRLVARASALMMIRDTKSE